jgi:hypothetical protein
MENENQRSGAKRLIIVEIFKGLHEKNSNLRAAVTLAVKQLDDKGKENS